ncbi:unnamed protein product, partial [Symbiodinium sp. KB8]
GEKKKAVNPDQITAVKAAIEEAEAAAQGMQSQGGGGGGGGGAAGDEDMGMPVAAGMSKEERIRMEEEAKAKAAAEAEAQKYASVEGADITKEINRLNLSSKLASKKWNERKAAWDEVRDLVNKNIKLAGSG